MTKHFESEGPSLGTTGKMKVLKAMTVRELIDRLIEVAHTHNAGNARWYGFDDGSIIIQTEKGRDDVCIDSMFYEQAPDAEDF